MLCTQCNNDRDENDFYTRHEYTIKKRQPCRFCMIEAAKGRYRKARHEDSVSLSLAMSMRQAGESIHETLQRVAEFLPNKGEVKYWSSGLAKEFVSDE